MKLTAKETISRTYKLLIASGALALGLTLVPTSASADAARVEVSKHYEYTSHRSHRSPYRGQRHYDHRRYDRRHYRSPRYDHRSHNSYRYRNDHYRPRYRSSHHFSIPRQLLRHQLHSLSHFFLGSYYYPAHHHRHMVYDFPVYSSSRVTYRTYAYCQGELYDQPYDDDDYD